jgi:hypothetical protein
MALTGVRLHESLTGVEINTALEYLVNNEELALTAEQRAVAERVAVTYLEQWLFERGHTLPRGWQFIDATTGSPKG